MSYVGCGCAVLGVLGQSILRMGVWAAPDPAPQTPLQKLDTTGTPVDVDALRAFMSHFNPCQEKA